MNRLKFPSLLFLFLFLPCIPFHFVALTALTALMALLIVMKQANKFLGTLDRIEENTAVILVGDDGYTIEISKDLLPEDAKEGDLLSIRLELKDRKTKAEKERVDRLIKKLSSEQSK